MKIGSKISFLLNYYKKTPVQIKAAIAFFICSLFQKGISIFTTPVFTRILSAEEYGQFGAFSSWYEIIAAIVSFSLVGGVYTIALVKFDEEKNVLASSSQGLILISCALWATIYIIFCEFFSSIFLLTNVQMIAMFFMICTSTSYGLWALEQRVAYRYKRLVLITVIVSIAKPVIGIILTMNFDAKVTFRIIGLAVVEIIFYGWIIIYQLNRGKKLFSKKYWIYVVKYSLPLIPHSISQIVLNSSDRIMIQSLVGDAQAGFYNLAYTLASIMIIVNSSLSQTLAPWTYQKLKNNKENEINRIAVISCVVVACMNLLLILIAPEIIMIFAPKNYLGAVYVVPPVAMSIFFMHLYDWFVRVEYYYEKTQYVLVASLTGAIINIILNFILIPKFGYLVAGYTTLLSFIVYAVMHYYFMRRISKKELNGKNIYNIKQILLVSCLFIIFGLSINFVYDDWKLRYALLLLFVIIVIIKRKSFYSIINDFLSSRKQEN